ncbi:MAG TPA: transcriptional repressor LexA [Candidatus Enterenecus stercoripullorum]|nr:transcriptional repressor LexA [Candidatus Enterenecus stercoripullorum]
MSKLSPKQQQIYDYILSFSEEHGYPPSVREIAQAVDLRSPSTVHFHLKGLREAGLISQAEGKTRAISITDGAHNRRNQVPLLGSVAAGTPILAEECIEEYLTFDTGGHMGEHFALRVRGESMLEAGILPGDVVVVHQQQQVRNGDIVVALFEDEATVKIYRRENGHIWLYPENSSPEYQPIDGEGCRILGRVVAVIRRY